MSTLSPPFFEVHCFLHYCLSDLWTCNLTWCELVNVVRVKIESQNYNKSAGYTQQEIDGFQKFLESNLVDSFRSLHPDEVSYSYWNYLFNARDRNVGWRIDYFLVSQQLMSRVSSASILGDYYGSDHCPVEIEIE